MRRLIARALAFVGVAEGIRRLIRLSDAFTNIQNRLSSVLGGTDEVAASTKALFEISNRTRASFEATAEVYSRLALSSQELGISQGELLRITETLNKATIIGGATTQEARNGLIQLSQAFASSRLSGDELRSVFEQLPFVTKLLAENLGVTIGRLRELGFSGQLTTEVLVRALQAGADQADEIFAKLSPTIGQAFQVVNNEFLRLVGSFNQVTGLSTGIAEGLIVISRNLETLSRAALAAAIALGIRGFAGAINIATAAVIRLTAAIARNPLGAVATLALLAVSGLIAFSDQLRVGERRLATLRDVGVATFEALRRAIESTTALVQAFYESAVPSGASNPIVSAFNALISPLRGLFSGGDGIEVEADGFFGRILARAEELARQRELLEQATTTPTTSGRAVSSGPNLTDRNAILEREIRLLGQEGDVLRIVGDERAILAARLAVEEKLRRALRSANDKLSEAEINRLATLPDGGAICCGSCRSAQRDPTP